MISQISNDAQASDLAYLVDILADKIAKDYGGLDPKHFRGSVEDVLVVLADLGLDSSTIRRVLAANAGPKPDTQH